MYNQEENVGLGSARFMGWSSSLLPQGSALRLVVGVLRSPLRGTSHPTPRCLPQVSEGPCLFLRGALGAASLKTHASLSSPPGGHPPTSYDNILDKASSLSHQRWPRGEPEAGGGLIQWI